MVDLNVATLDGSSATLSEESVAEFSTRMRGQVIQPDDDAYEQARMVWNGNIDRRPALIAQCKGVGDVIDAVVALMDCPQAQGRVFNIGSTEEISIEALADKIIQLTNSSSQKQFRTYQEAYGKSFDDMIRRVPSVDRLKDTIGFSPQTPLDKTLQIIIEKVKKRTSC